MFRFFHIYVYIYIKREREKDREIEREREREREKLIHFEPLEGSGEACAGERKRLVIACAGETAFKGYSSRWRKK